MTTLTFALALLGVSIAAAAASAGARADHETQSQRRFDGKTEFMLYCASCHGASARGDGPLADSMRRRPPDLTLFARNNKNVFPADTVARIIDGREPIKGHGGPDMPVWGDAFSRSRDSSDPESVKLRIQALVEFLKSIQQPAASQ
jgi:mono/diheme cytochrome c family protein